MTSQLQQDQRLDGREKRILISTSFGHFMSHFNVVVFPAVALPLTARLNMSLADVLGLSFWMYLLFGLTALPWGMAGDRMCPRRLMGIYHFGSAVCAFLAAAYLDHPGLFSLFLAGIGIFSGIYHPIGLGLISKEIKRVSLGMGINGMFGNLGLAIAPLFTGWAVWLWGPRAAYIALGIFNIIGFGLAFSFPRPAEGQTGEKTAGKDDSVAVAAFILLLIAMMLGGIEYRGAVVISPAYFELKTPAVFAWVSTLFGSSVSRNLVATSATSLIFLVGMMGQYMGGRLAERYNTIYAYLGFHLFTIPAAFFMAKLGDLPLLLAALIYFFFLLGMQPMENTLVARFTPRRFHHSAFGAKFILTFGVGALAVKMVEGISNTWSIGPVYYALGSLGVVLVCVIGVLAKTVSAGSRSSAGVICADAMENR